MIEQTISPLEMTDEDILNTSLSQLPTEFPTESEPETESSEQEEPEQEKEEEDEKEEEEPRESESQEDYYEEEEEEEGEESSKVVETDIIKGKKADALNDVDYKKEYERLFEPFKASDRKVKIKSVDDALRLMKMGVDYQVKMQALKPHLRLLKALEKNNLVDEDKINFIIDVQKGNKEAIAKLLSEHALDPLEVGGAEEYSPKNYAPSENEYALDEVLDQIKSTDTYDKVVSEIGNKWDIPSKQIMLKNPQILSIINNHIAAGIYDKIMDIVESERMLGRLEGTSDLDAYKMVGDALDAQGAFNGQTSKPNPKPKTDQNLKDRKKAAGAPKRSAGKTASKSFNPLSMSDDEIEKMSINNFVTV